MADREARVKAGEDLVVTQHGREVARLMPIGADACADLATRFGASVPPSVSK